MKQKTITLSYEELFLLYQEAKANDYLIYNDVMDDGEVWENDPHRLKVIKLYDKLEKKYNWKS